MVGFERNVITLIANAGRDIVSVGICGVDVPPIGSAFPPRMNFFNKFCHPCAIKQDQNYPPDNWAGRIAVWYARAY